LTFHDANISPTSTVPPDQPTYPAVVCVDSCPISRPTRTRFPHVTLASSVPNVYTKEMELCMIEGCGRDARSVGRCHSHYEHWRRNGVDCDPFPETFEDRFWLKVAKGGDEDCWLWTAATDGDGRYGSIFRDGRLLRAHRAAYEMTHGEIADGMVVDHLCRVTLCVNPSHLEIVDQRTNILRGLAPSALNAVKTHCKRGHEFTPTNTRQMSTGGRSCLTCEVEYHAPRSLERRKQKKLLTG